MTAHPHTSSDVHHHGEESMPYPLTIRIANSTDTIVYAVKGHGTIVSDGGKTRQDLSPGDWALIPAFAEHQEANDSDEDVVWAIIRSGRVPIVKNLSGWGRDSAKGN